MTFVTVGNIESESMSSVSNYVADMDMIVSGMTKIKSGAVETWGTTKT